MRFQPIKHKEWISFRIDTMSDEQKAKLQKYIAEEKPLRIIENEISCLGIFGYHMRKDEVDL